jgi:tripartite ATP-independent transporter DctM subunit
VLSAFLLALVDAGLRLHWLSALTRRVTFVLIPPLILIFLVLGTIFLGVATPTEGGALGAVGAVVLAAARGRLSLREAAQALLATTKLSTLVMFVLIGSTVFSLVFQGADGSVWVERLFVDLPGGASGFLLAVTLLVFVLGFFLDFFEIAFILLPLLAPVAQKLGIDLIWFGVLMGINLQASFMTPPFGFSLFFLRGVAPQQDYTDPRSGGIVRRIATSDIYLGVLPFVAVQVLVMVLVIAFPSLVLRDAQGGAKMDGPAIERALRDMAPGAAPVAPADPVRLLLDSLRPTR